jgi:Tfp pilus assembly protein PilV
LFATQQSRFHLPRYVFSTMNNGSGYGFNPSCCCIALSYTLYCCTAAQLLLLSTEAEEAAGPEDYTSIIFNLHVWSYRLSQQASSRHQQAKQWQPAAAGSQCMRLSNKYLPRQHSSTFKFHAERSAECFKYQVPFSQISSQQHNAHARRNSLTMSTAASCARQPGTLTPATSVCSSEHNSRWQQPPLQQQQQQQQLLLQDPSRYIGFNRSLQRSGSVSRKTPKPRTLLGLPVLPVSHPAMAAWSVLMLLLDMSYTAVLLPLMFAFGMMRPSFRAYWLSVAMGFLFLADMVMVMHRWAAVDRNLLFNMLYSH